MKILVTGAAGFIGFHLVQKLCNTGHAVTGIDNINDYYDVKLKNDRLALNSKLDNYKLYKIDLNEKEKLFQLFNDEQFDCVCNLAAQAGVRYSLENPYAYIDSNICGFLNILEACRNDNIKHLVYASSSSVYGINEKVPFAEEDTVNRPVSLYAATKISNELMAYTYSYLYNLPVTGLRFFTVYGPWGRPDMAYFKFAKAIINNEEIEVYNNGEMLRDFTYIDDIIEGIVLAINKIPSSNPPHVIYNLGNNQPVKLTHFIETLEKSLGKDAKKSFLGMQAGDVPVTYADIESARKELGWQPGISLEEGLNCFTKWFREYSL